MVKRKQQQDSWFLLITTHVKEHSITQQQKMEVDWHKNSFISRTHSSSQAVFKKGETTKAIEIGWSVGTQVRLAKGQKPWTCFQKGYFVYKFYASSRLTSLPGIKKERTYSLSVHLFVLVVWPTHTPPTEPAPRTVWLAMVSLIKLRSSGFELR